MCVIDVFRKYACVVPLKDKKGVTITNAFQKILKKSNKKPKKYGLTKQANFTIAFFTKWLKDNDIEMYSIYNRKKFVVAERFIRTWKSKIHKYMTSISKNVYMDKLDDIVNEYNNAYHRTIKMKPVDVKDNTFIDSIESHSNDKDPKFKVSDLVKNVFSFLYIITVLHRHIIN